MSRCHSKDLKKDTQNIKINAEVENAMKILRTKLPFAIMVYKMVFLLPYLSPLLFHIFFSTKT